MNRLNVKFSIGMEVCDAKSSQLVYLMNSIQTYIDVFCTSTINAFNGEELNFC